MDFEGVVIAITMVDSKDSTIFKATLGTDKAKRSFFISLEGLEQTEYKELTKTIKMGQVYKLRLIPLNKGNPNIGGE